MKQKEEDKVFQQMMSKSRLEISDPGFEDDVMMAIEKEQLRESSKRDLTLSWIFFAAGVIFGIILSNLLPQTQLAIPGMETGTLTSIFQILFALFVLLHLETLIRMTRRILKPAKEFTVDY